MSENDEYILVDGGGGRRGGGIAAGGRGGESGGGVGVVDGFSDFSHIHVKVTAESAEEDTFKDAHTSTWYDASNEPTVIHYKYCLLSISLLLFHLPERGASHTTFSTIKSRSDIIVTSTTPSSTRDTCSNTGMWYSIR